MTSSGKVTPELNEARKALSQGFWGRNRIRPDVQEKIAAFAERVRPRESPPRR